MTSEKEPSESGCLPAAILIVIYAPLKWLFGLFGGKEEPSDGDDHNK